MIPNLSTGSYWLSFQKRNWSCVLTAWHLMSCKQHHTRLSSKWHHCPLIKELDKSTDINQWKFAVNTKDDLRQQTNAYDCGIFTCLYANCLVNQGVMIDDPSINSFRKLMLLDLHRRSLHPYPLKELNLNTTMQ